MSDPRVTATGMFASSALIIPDILPGITRGRTHLSLDPVPSIGDLLEAEREIEAKAAQLGSSLGGSAADLTVVRGGWLRSYEGFDIYFSSATGAHEVHGDIRAKYNALGGANGVLGLPTTDESQAIGGRFNHFQDGSIYWSPDTGPKMVRGAIRDAWANQGWEGGWLGFPVADEYRIRPAFPGDAPKVAWSLFQNGAVVENSEGTQPALAAELTPDELRFVVRRFFDQELHRSPDNVGLQPQIDMLAVSDWSPDFWLARGRTVSFRLHGFRDNGLLNDTDFTIDIRLRFSLTWPAEVNEPTVKTLIAGLDWLSVTADGVASGTIANALYNGIHATFFPATPDPERPEVPPGAVLIHRIPTGASQTGAGNIDVVDVLTTAEGGLQILVPAGGGRLLGAQAALQGFLQG